MLHHGNERSNRLKADRPEHNEQIKACPLCSETFSIDQLMENPHFVPIGMRLDDSEPSLNLFFFDHAIESCNTTFVIPILWFRSLLREPAPLANLAGSCSCAQYCSSIEDFSTCNKECGWAPYRRLLKEMMQAKEITIPGTRQLIIAEE